MLYEFIGDKMNIIKKTTIKGVIDMIGKKVKGYSKLTESMVTGIVTDKGCFRNSYMVNIGNITVRVAGKLLTNELIFFENELTIIE